ncbi:MAG: SpoIIE family protein phosphatase [Thermoanaerobaculia bacterium]
MSLRAKLILSFLLLSVLPLSAIVAFGYVSSTRALRVAAWEESTRLAAQLSERMEDAEDRLGSRIQLLKEFPLDGLVAAAQDGFPPGASLDAEELERAMSDLAPFVESLEFVPEPPTPPAPPSPPAPPAAPTPPAPPTPASPATPASVGTKGSPIVIDFQAATERMPDPHAVRLVVERALASVQGTLAPVAAAEVEADPAIPLGQSYECPVEEAGRTIGTWKAKVAAKRILHSVLGAAERDEGEIPFALDADGNLYAADDEDREALAAVGTDVLRDKGEPRGDWVVVRSDYPGSELKFGIARPLSGSLRELRRAAASNLAFGLGLVGLALVGVVPLSRRITRDLGALTQGAERLAAGDLEVKVPVRSRDEVGRLATTFNRMALDLKENQARLVESELQHRLLESENERRGRELEEARRFQLSLLPKELPRLGSLEVAVFMRTATEVGGDYYDFHQADDGTLTVAIGDATGHGARAGTMVTVIKSLFTAQAPTADLPSFLSDAAASIRRMELGRMAMALALARIEGRRLILSSAGMPPVLICHRGEVREVALQGLPLGGMAQAAYQRHETELEAGDVVLLMSDGLPELLDDDGEPFGYARVRTALGACEGLDPHGVIDALATAARRWAGDRPPGDDMTFVALRLR